MFDRVRAVEAGFGGGLAGFQYIVTTTPPPESCGREPFVRLTLDARTDAGALLGVRW